jgi:hypothetical protein
MSWNSFHRLDCFLGFLIVGKPVSWSTDIRAWIIWPLLVFATFSNVVQICDLQITATDRGPLIDELCQYPNKTSEMFRRTRGVGKIGLRWTCTRARRWRINHHPGNIPALKAMFHVWCLGKFPWTHDPLLKRVNRPRVLEAKR